MNTTTRIPNPPEDGAGLDQLLASYFRSEMPARWPTTPQPWTDKARAATTNPTVDPSRKSRWALAASVALLIGGCWYLSGHMSDGKVKQGLDLGNGEAKPPAVIKDHMAPKTKTP
jgi:hypothetical protein